MGAFGAAADRDTENGGKEQRMLMQRGRKHPVVSSSRALVSAVLLSLGQAVWAGTGDEGSWEINGIHPGMEIKAAAAALGVSVKRYTRKFADGKIGWSVVSKAPCGAWDYQGARATQDELGTSIRSVDVYKVFEAHVSPDWDSILKKLTAKFGNPTKISTRRGDWNPVYQWKKGKLSAEAEFWKRAELHSRSSPSRLAAGHVINYGKDAVVMICVRDHDLCIADNELERKKEVRLLQEQESIDL